MANTFKILAKFILAAGIFTWLIKQGKIDFSLITKAIEAKTGIMLALTFILLQILLGAVRWLILLKAGSKAHIPFKSILSLTWIGLFFSSVLPGAVTGDIVKVVYARKLDTNLSKTFLVMSVLMDRVLGLMGLLFLTGLFSIFTYSELTALSGKMKLLLNFNLLLFAGSMVFISCLFSPISLQTKVLQFTCKIPFLGERIARTLEQTWLFGRKKRIVLGALLLSLMTQMLNILAFYSISSPFYPIHISFPHAFTFMPIGFIAVAIPISPAGLGVGHAVFNNLFKIFNIDQGASFFNLHFLLYVSVNLFGVFPYLFSNSKSSLKELTEENTSEQT